MGVGTKGGGMCKRRPGRVLPPSSGHLVQRQRVHLQVSLPTKFFTFHSSNTQLKKQGKAQKFECAPCPTPACTPPGLPPNDAS
eukprot:453367-Pelagomonas_calceolata.AAC.2